ncbi:MAG TPA: sensor histidine kinase [Sphingomicrobium sp.]|nr:sensor histidine kinase [Sphingomicrobium sp.]
MVSAVNRRFAALPTAAKLLLILSLVLLPIGLGLFAVARDGIEQANRALRERTDDHARTAARAIESLVARNALALRIAANGALAGGSAGACDRARRSLAIAPAVAQIFEIDDLDGRPMCAFGPIMAAPDLPVVAPGGISLKIAPDRDALIFRVGVIGGMATGSLPRDEIRAAVGAGSTGIVDLYIADGDRRMGVISSPPDLASNMRSSNSVWRIGDDSLTVNVAGRMPQITTIDRLLLLLPLAMWVIAALLTWLMVTRLLIRPLKGLQRAVTAYQPGNQGLELPQNLGPSREIQELSESFARAVTRIEQSENEMAGALEGQRRLVREVHHRVKNNLQVVASLLNIHGRTAGSADARSAYAAIGRRVSALSVVHRNHFAELEENRGIALRPLLSELSAELRAGAPEEARALQIDLEADTINTTQDVAVSVAFLVTEMVEFAMLNRPSDPIEISLQRTSELTARLAIASPVLVPEPEEDSAEKTQFERIIAGLAKQLRSNLERKLGRYSVDLPAFPPS